MGGPIPRSPKLGSPMELGAFGKEWESNSSLEFSPRRLSKSNENKTCEELLVRRVECWNEGPERRNRRSQVDRMASSDVVSWMAASDRVSSPRGLWT